MHQGCLFLGIIPRKNLARHKGIALKPAQADKESHSSSSPGKARCFRIEKESLVKSKSVMPGWLARTDRSLMSSGARSLMQTAAVSRGAAGGFVNTKEGPGIRYCFFAGEKVLQIDGSAIPSGCFLPCLGTPGHDGIYPLTEPVYLFLLRELRVGFRVFAFSGETSQPIL